ncbi:hypothetical protein QTP88_002010 [Uroleucon formosanum]
MLSLLKTKNDPSDDNIVVDKDILDNPDPETPDVNVIKNSAKCLLTPEQQIAITRLVETWETLLLLKNRDSPIDEFPETTANDESTIESTIESSQDSTDPFEDFLSSQASFTSNSSASSLTVSVERSFSGLKFVVSDLRTSLDPELLEAMKILNYVIK